MNIGLEIFHTERSACYSEFLVQTSGVQFISIEEQQTSKLRVDYFISASENSNTHKILADMQIADGYSGGKFIFLI